MLYTYTVYDVYEIIFINVPYSPSLVGGSGI
jgi:hypothetical protein